MIVFAYMKKIIYSAFIALSLCACDSNKDESFNSTPEIPASSVVYHVSLPASFDAQTRAVTFGSDGESITTQFESGDRIYVYNETKGAWARRYAGGSLSYLQPTNISGSTCTLVGDFSFYKMNGQEWELVTVEDGDTYSLYYQMNEPGYKYSNKYIPRFNYGIQNGSAESASKCDFAEAKGVAMTLTGNTLTTSDEIGFQNLQSMFRQRLRFTKGGETVIPTTITKLTVGTKNETLLFYYRPKDGNEIKAYDGFDIDNPQITADGDIYLSLGFYYTNAHPAEGDQLILTAVDDEGNVYQGAKDVPAGGFVKSKYYYGDCELTWKYQIVKPTVSRSDGGNVDELEPWDSEYDIYAGPGDQIAITISGNSSPYWFYLNDYPAVVTLAGDGTAIFDDNEPFIFADYDLTIELASDYTIICSGHQGAIWAGSGNLKLKTTGSGQKLTVTANRFTYSGIYGYTNYDRGIESDVNALAADGFTVTRSDPVDNHDGTFTWVYTVSPNQ